MRRSTYRWSLALAWAPGFCALGFCALPLALHASVAGVEPARTGGFGELTCQQCHWENPLNDPSGRIELAGVPATYTPGEQYLITITLARPDLRRAGFQVAAREDGINMSAGTNAGSLAATDELAEATHSDKGVGYIRHTESGTHVSPPGTARWQVEWTAPEMPGVPVVFHVAANAANDDSSPLGDFIYTASAQSR